MGVMMGQGCPELWYYASTRKPRGKINGTVVFEMITGRLIIMILIYSPNCTPTSHLALTYPPKFRTDQRDSGPVAPST
jgi:hypothetical protein